MSHFIYEENDFIDNELCDKIIKKFDEDDKEENMKCDFDDMNDLNIFKRNINKLNILDITLRVNRCEEWKNIDKTLNDKLGDAIIRYENKTSYFNINIFTNNIKNDWGYTIYKYEKNKDFFNWHIENLNYYAYNRIILYTFIIFLNDIDKGGEINFLFAKIKPKRGKILIYPSDWYFINKSEISKSNDKYIITGNIGIVMQETI